MKYGRCYEFSKLLLNSELYHTVSLSNAFVKQTEMSVYKLCMYFYRWQSTIISPIAIFVVPIFGSYDIM